jgi:hypothetical protein
MTPQIGEIASSQKRLEKSLQGADGALLPRHPVRDARGVLELAQVLQVPAKVPDQGFIVRELRTPPAERPPLAVRCRVGGGSSPSVQPRVCRENLRRDATPPWKYFLCFSKRYCVALGSRVWCFRIKHWECGCGDAHPCGLRDVQTRRKAAQCLGASFRGLGRIAEQSGGATKLRPQRGGRARMAAEAHNGACTPSVNPAKMAHP